MKRNALAALILAAGVLAGCDDAPPARAEFQESDRIALEARADSEARLRELKAKVIYLRDGAAVGNLYVHCIEEPPKQAPNQKRCQALLERLRKEDAATEKASAKAKARW